MSAARDVRILHTTYRVYLTLMDSQWNRLEREARRRNIGGKELIQAALSQYIHALPEEIEPPPPDEPPEDA